MTKVMREATPELAILPETICYIIMKARQFDAKDVATETDHTTDDNDKAIWMATQKIR